MKRLLPHQSGNMGIHIGKFTVTRQVGDQITCRFVAKSNLGVGDRLRLHVEPSGDRTPFRLKSLFVSGVEKERVVAGTKVSIGLPVGFQVGSGEQVDLYKVDGASRLDTDSVGWLQTRKIGKELTHKKKQLSATVDHIVTKVCGIDSAIDQIDGESKENRTRPPSRKRPHKETISTGLVAENGFDKNSVGRFALFSRSLSAQF